MIPRGSCWKPRPPYPITSSRIPGMIDILVLILSIVNIRFHCAGAPRPAGPEPPAATECSDGHARP